MMPSEQSKVRAAASGWVEAHVTVRSPLGFHLRPATTIAEMVRPFADTDVELEFGGKVVDASSMLAMMQIASEPGTPFTIRARGPGAAEIVASIAAFFDDAFGEKDAVPGETQSDDATTQQ